MRTSVRCGTMIPTGLTQRCILLQIIASITRVVASSTSKKKARKTGVAKEERRLCSYAAVRCQGSIKGTLKKN